MTSQQPVSASFGRTMSWYSSTPAHLRTSENGLHRRRANINAWRVGDDYCNSLQIRSPGGCIAMSHSDTIRASADRPVDVRQAGKHPIYGLQQQQQQLRFPQPIYREVDSLMVAAVQQRRTSTLEHRRTDQVGTKTNVGSGNFRRASSFSSSNPSFRAANVDVGRCLQEKNDVDVALGLNVFRVNSPVTLSGFNGDRRTSIVCTDGDWRTSPAYQGEGRMTSSATSGTLSESKLVAFHDIAIIGEEDKGNRDRLKTQG